MKTNLLAIACVAFLSVDAYVIRPFGKRKVADAKTKVPTDVSKK